MKIYSHTSLKLKTSTENSCKFLFTLAVGIVKLRNLFNPLIKHLQYKQLHCNIQQALYLYYITYHLCNFKYIKHLHGPDSKNTSDHLLKTK